MDISNELIVNMGALTFINAAIRQELGKEAAEKIYDTAVELANMHPGQQGHDRIVALIGTFRKALDKKEHHA